MDCFGLVKNTLYVNLQLQLIFYVASAYMITYISGSHACMVCYMHMVWLGMHISIRTYLIFVFNNLTVCIT